MCNQDLSTHSSQTPPFLLKSPLVKKRLVLLLLVLLSAFAASPTACLFGVTDLICAENLVSECVLYRLQRGWCPLQATKQSTDHIPAQTTLAVQVHIPTQVTNSKHTNLSARLKHEENPRPVSSTNYQSHTNGSQMIIATRKIIQKNYCYFKELKEDRNKGMNDTGCQR